MHRSPQDEAAAGTAAAASEASGTSFTGRPRELALIEAPPSLTDNALRKTISLPLLKQHPAKARSAAAKSRPWRRGGE